MIKVLVVDDDKLARKGLISAMPWRDFDMQVVGEANNGEKALEYLASNPVDLMLADLAMPVMSGIELMRIARQRYPNLHIAVLTLHQDFEYVQEALRLGAIDYIAKVQLEQEHFEEVLGRIYGRILQEQNKIALAELHEKAYVPFYSDIGYVLISTDEQPDTEWIHRAIVSPNWDPGEIGNGLWLWVPADDSDHGSEYADLSRAVIEKNGWMLLRLEGLKGENRSVVHRLLRRYRQKDFFYDYDSSSKIISKSINELGCEPPVTSEEEAESLKDRWLSFKWIQHDSLFEQLLNELKKMRLPATKLLHLLVMLENEWNRIYRSVTSCRMEAPETISSWQEVENWLRAVCELTVKAISKQPYSQEVTDCVMKAVKIVQEEMDQQVFAVDVAKRVNMSRSYFSQCFKDIVGKSFNAYLRFVRIEKAKEYLLKTDKPIQWIAERTGYMDEKYFSHVFREQTGVLPSEYRQKGREGRVVSDG